MELEDLFKALAQEGFYPEDITTGNEHKVYFYTDKNILIVVDESLQFNLEGKVNQIYFVCTIYGDMETACDEFIRLQLANGFLPMVSADQHDVLSTSHPNRGIPRVIEIIRMLREFNPQIKPGQEYWNPAKQEHDTWTSRLPDSEKPKSKDIRD